nr:MAG TPA: hypothetical protein [Caudoviricetes sp.]
MDKEFTESLKRWLETPREERDVREGAELLLRINGNRHIYNLAMNRPEAAHDHVEYDLKKFLQIRLDGHTVESIREMERELLPKVRSLIPPPEEETESELSEDDTVEETPTAPNAHRGRRPDHGELPEHIRAIYDRGGELYEKIRRTFTELQDLEKAPPCDRYEKIKILEGLYEEYIAGWDEYDAYGTADEDEETTEPEDPGNEVKRVAAARKFISAHVAKLEQLLKTEEPAPDEIEEERRQITERINLIVETGGSFKPDFAQRLRDIGVEMPTEQPTAE